MNRFLLISVGTLSCILLGVLFGGSSVNAASVYDNFFDDRVTDKILLNHPQCDPVDITNDYVSRMVKPKSYSYGSDQRALEIHDKFVSDMQNPNTKWAITVNETSGSMQLVWSTNPDTKTQFITQDWQRFRLMPYSRTETWRVTIRQHFEANCDIGMMWSNSSYTESPTNLDLLNNTSTASKLFLSTFPFVEPEGYDGETPPDSHTEECLRECRIVIAPNFEYEYDDKQISVTDLENDLLPEFEPDEGYTSLGYEIEWSLWKCSVEYDNGLCKNGENELVELKHTPLLEGNTWNNLDHGYYRVEAQYVVQQCYRYPSYPATPDYCFYVDLGTEFGKVYLFEKRSRSINLDGTSGSGNTSDENCDVSGECTPSTVGGLLPCFGPDPPFVQVDGCVKNIFWVVDSLSFSKITIMEIRSNTMQCKQLDTIGGWINRPGITVCPMFPSHVRDVVTPFVTLAIGLFLGSFIMSLASRGVR